MGRGDRGALAAIVLVVVLVVAGPKNDAVVAKPAAPPAASVTAPSDDGSVASGNVGRGRRLLDANAAHANQGR